MGILSLITPGGREKRRFIKEARKITNEQLLQELDAIVLLATGAIQDNNHSQVVNVLKHLIFHDLLLRRIIQNHLSPKGHSKSFIFSDSLSDDSLNHVIELQSWYNVMRNNLLMEVINILLKGYNEVEKALQINIDDAMNWYSYTKDLNTFYINELNFLGTDADEQQLKVFKECMDSFEEVFNTANKSIRDLLSTSVRELRMLAP